MTTESFASGSSVGPYRIIDRLGAGGMGEVFLAEDTKLGREVALKVLPDEFARDPERRMRLEREARLLASLNHPNVATLHGLQEFGHHAILEMELVPGQTLAERLKAGPIRTADALPILKQIAAGLEAAHERGIIHRDLKPANIKLLPDGRVKVLDFGVGKIFEQGRLDDRTMSLSDATGSGAVILGTAQYMSPEQARGQALDPRTDIWSFGCVMFEVLTGRAPFKKETGSDTLAAILREEPDWNLLATQPRTLQRLVRRCLQKDPKARVRDIADARFEIEELLADTTAVRALDGPPRATGMRWPVVAGIAAAILMLAAGALYFARPVATTPALGIRVAIPIAAGQRFATGAASVLAISNDGAQLVYAAAAASRTQLFLRPLDRFDAAPIPGTDGATAPFFSYDGQWVGFHAGKSLHKVSLAGGTPLKIADVPSLAAATWGEDDTILFTTTAADGVWRIAPGSSAPQQLTRPDAANGETQHAYPQLLPGGKTALITVTVGGQPHPAVLALDTAKWKTLLPITASGARFVPPAHLAYVQSGGLVVVGFDAGRGELRGSPVPLLERVESPANGAPQFAVSENGSLVYVPGQTARGARSLIALDRDGRSSPLAAARASYAHPRVSPDGRWVAVTVETDTGSDIWVYDLQRGTRTRLTSNGTSGFPVWTPDGKNITYHSTSSDLWTLFSRPADASGPAQPLLTLARPTSGPPAAAALLPGTLPSLSGANPQFPMSWSGDGRALAFTERKLSAERDVWVMEQGADPSPFLMSPFDESSPAFSPDGRFLAYVSDESGVPEVYVQPYPGPGRRWLISTDGGTDPVWPAPGRELFYRNGDAIMAVAIQAGAEFTAGAPRRMLEARFDGSEAARNFDIARDGQRFVTVRSDESVAPLQFHAVFNWLAEIKRRAGAPK